jgi:hypothetical protein
MDPTPTARVRLIAALAVAGVAFWSAGHADRPAQSAGTMQLAQVYAPPVGEGDGPIGGPMAYGAPVQSYGEDQPIGGPMIYGGSVGDAPIGGPMLYGGPVGNAPIGGPMLYGAPVESSGEDQPIGGAPLY